MKAYKVAIDLTLTLDSTSLKRATHIVERKLRLFLKGMGVKYQYMRIKEIEYDSSK